MSTHDATQEFAVIDPKGQSTLWQAEDFWQMAMNPSHPQNTANMGYLVSQYEFSEDWKSWENHPNGDELVFCLSGTMRFVLETESGEKEIKLETGKYLVVPRNTWHTARIDGPVKALFITWGFGTQHRDAP